MSHHTNSLSLPQKQTRQFWILITGLSLFWCVLVIALYFSLPTSQLKLYFLDVGQGDSALIITPQYQKIIIDGGPDQKVLTQISKIIPFWDHKIDAMILSHADQDHIGGLIHLAERFKVGTLYIGIKNHINPQLNKLIRLVQSSGGKIAILNSRRDLAIDHQLIIDVFSPMDAIVTRSKNINNDSLIFKLLSPYGTVLFTGDIGIDTEKQLASIYNKKLESDILKVAHHGSSGSSASQFLAYASAKSAIISVGAENDFGHPHSLTIKRLQDNNMEIYRTDLCGTIKLLPQLVDQKSMFNISCSISS